LPEPLQPREPQVDGVEAPRSDTERALDHAAIERLSAELLPALIAKLGATGLGELEVREGGWRVRLRRPGDGSASPSTRDRRPGERERAARSGAGPGGPHLPAGLTAVGPGREPRDGAGHDGHAARDGRDNGRIVATSPAVGVFQPRQDARAGTRVRAGDRLGSVDMLGVPQEVVSPADGVVGASLVEAGDAVEYGQELILLEFASAASPEA
jgi:biotin carboxyl carrier protein